MEYRCSFPNCAYKTTLTRNIKRHNKMHNRINLYNCDYKNCKLSFKYHRELREHRRIVHNERLIDYIYGNLNHKK